jgi:hypothetical protein
MKRVVFLSVMTALSGPLLSAHAQAQSITNMTSVFRQFDVPELDSESSCVAGTIYSSDGSMAPKPFAEAMLVCRANKNPLMAKWIIHIANDAFLSGQSKGARIALAPQAKARLGKDCQFNQEWTCQSYVPVSKFSVVLVKDPDFMDEDKDFQYLSIATAAPANPMVKAGKIEFAALKGTLRPPEDFPSCEYRVGKKLIARDSFQEPSTQGLIVNFAGDDVFVPIKETGNKMNPTLVGQAGPIKLQAVPGKVKSSGRGSEGSAATPMKMSLTEEGSAPVTVDAVRECGPN